MSKSLPLVTLAVLLKMTAAAWADDAGVSDAGASVDAGSQLSCGEIRDTYLVPEGTTCKTSSGNAFTRVAGGWRDLSLGLTLFDRMINPEEIQPNIKVVLLDPEVRDDRWAMSDQWCKSQGLALPARKDFAELHRHKFLELLRDMNGHAFWASDVTPDWNLLGKVIPAPLRDLYNSRIGAVVSDVRDVRENNAPQKEWKAFIYARCSAR